jgi:hypothetical protein
MALLLEPDDYLDIGLGKIVIGNMYENLNLFCKTKDENLLH